MYVRAVRSDEEVQGAVEFAKSIFGLSGEHRRGFLRYYQRCYQEHPELLIIAEEHGQIHGIVLSCVEGDHIKIGEVAVAAAYRRQGIGSRMLELVERHGQQLGFSRFLLGAQERAYAFYASNDYEPELYFAVENSIDPAHFEAYISRELYRYPLIWKQHDHYGSRAIVKTPSPDLELLHRVERALPTCGAQYLFFKDISVKV